MKQIVKQVIARIFNRKEQDNKPEFLVGEVVKIRSIEEISQGLDLLKRHEGCLMMEQMWIYCNSNFKILRIVDNVFDEYQFKMFKTRGPLYLLEGLICNGKVDSFQHQCDRSCYLMWHEDWLSKI